MIHKASVKHKIHPRLYTAILMQESGYKLDAKNCGPEKCTDFGIAQIYYKTAKRYNFDIQKLLTDLEYSVNAGAKVLAWFRKTYASSEKYWWCRYNTGTAPFSKIRHICLKYRRLVSRFL